MPDYERAIEEYGQAIELNPEYATAYYNTACAYALMGKPDESCEWLQKAINLDDEYRGMARTDQDFNPIRDDPTFASLVGERLENK